MLEISMQLLQKSVLMKLSEKLGGRKWGRGPYEQRRVQTFM